MRQNILLTIFFFNWIFSNFKFEFEKFEILRQNLKILILLIIFVSTDTFKVVILAPKFKLHVWYISNLKNLNLNLNFGAKIQIKCIIHYELEKLEFKTWILAPKLKSIFDVWLWFEFSRQKRITVFLKKKIWLGMLYSFKSKTLTSFFQTTICSYMRETFPCFSESISLSFAVAPDMSILGHL